MKKISAILAILIIVTGISGCVKKIDKGEVTNLYPAFKMEENEKLWGYIDHKGEFKVEAKYDFADDFSIEGLARVEIKGLSGVINSKGEEILSPNYKTISEFKNGYFLAFDGENNQIYDYKGDRQFLGEKDYIYIGPYSDGLFTVLRLNSDGEMKMGYVDRAGSQIIPAEYFKAYNFHNGRALVEKYDSESHQIIDKDGNTIKELNYSEVKAGPRDGVYLFRGNDGQYGLLDFNGDILVEDKFDSILDMDGEHILVSFLKDKKILFGVIDKKANYVIQPEYEDIKLLGEGYLGLGKGKNSVMGSVYAIADKNGKIITDFKYYGVGGYSGKIKNGLISVSDGEKTYALDLKGNISTKVKEVDGRGEVSFDGKLTRANINGNISYYNSNKELIWEEKNIYILKEGARVIEEKFLLGNSVNINYPVLEGLKNKAAEDKINKDLYKLFTSLYDSDGELKDGDYKYYKTDYKLNRVNDILIVEQISEISRNKDINPSIFGKIYNINLANGNFYELKDLFNQDSDYIGIVSDIIRGQIEAKIEKNEGIYDLSNWKAIRPDQEFIAQTETIDIYFNSDEINSYGEDFPRLTIKQEIIDDILDLNSEFWLAYNTSRGF